MSANIIVGLGEIAKKLGVSKRTARKILRRTDTPILQAYRPRIAVFEEDLLERVKGVTLQPASEPCVSTE